MSERQNKTITLVIALVAVILSTSLPFIAFPVSNYGVNNYSGYVTAGANEVSEEMPNSSIDVTIDHINNSTSLAGSMTVGFQGGSMSDNLSFITILEWYNNLRPMEVRSNTSASLISAETNQMWNSSNSYYGGAIMHLPQVRGEFCFKNSTRQNYTFTITWNIRLFLFNASLLNVLYHWLNFSIRADIPYYSETAIPEDYVILSLSVSGTAIVLIALVQISQKWLRNFGDESHRPD